MEPILSFFSICITLFCSCGGLGQRQSINERKLLNGAGFFIGCYHVFIINHLTVFYFYCQSGTLRHPCCPTYLYTCACKILKPEIYFLSTPLYGPSAVIFDVSISNEVVYAVIHRQWKDKQCINIKAVQTETTYPDLQMIFTRSILSSVQTSSHRLTQSPITIPQPKHTPMLSPPHTPDSVKALCVLIGLYWPTHRTTTYTHLLVDSVFHWLAGLTEWGEWGNKTVYLGQGSPIVAVWIPNCK